MADSCQHVNEPLGFVTGRQFTDCEFTWASQEEFRCIYKQVLYRCRLFEILKCWVYSSIRDRLWRRKSLSLQHTSTVKEVMSKTADDRPHGPAFVHVSVLFIRQLKRGNNLQVCYPPLPLTWLSYKYSERVSEAHLTKALKPTASRSTFL